MRTTAILWASVLALAFTGCMSSRSGVVLRVDDRAQTLKIDGDLYHLSRETRLYGPHGQMISLRDIPTIADPGAGVRHPERARVDFSVYRVRDLEVLDTVWVRPR